MIIQKINNALDSFKMLFPNSPKKEVVDHSFLGEDFLMVHEFKTQEQQEREFAKRQTLNYALLNRIDQRLTREMRYMICKEILNHMRDFRMAHFSSREKEFEVNAFDFATETFNVLSKWLDEQYENGGDFFEISAYSEEDHCSGNYNWETGGNSPLFINCIGSRAKSIRTMDVAGQIELTIYHELTHLLQDACRFRNKIKIDHDEYGKCWEYRWFEREAIYCSNKALSNRLYPPVHLDFEAEMTSEYGSFDFDSYTEKALFLKELLVLVREDSVNE